MACKQKDASNSFTGAVGKDTCNSASRKGTGTAQAGSWWCVEVLLMITKLHYILSEVTLLLYSMSTRSLIPFSCHFYVSTQEPCSNRTMLALMLPYTHWITWGTTTSSPINGQQKVPTLTRSNKFGMPLKRKYSNDQFSPATLHNLAKHLLMNGRDFLNISCGAWSLPCPDAVRLLLLQEAVIPAIKPVVFS